MHFWRDVPLRQLVSLSLVFACAAGCQQFQFRKNKASSAAVEKKGSVFPSGKNLFASKDRQKDAQPQDTVTKITPKMEADVQFAQARLLESEGQIQQASAMYEEVIKRDKRRADAHHRLAILASKQGKFEDSEEWFQKALKADHDNPEICCDFGYSLYLQGRMDEAETRLKEAIKADNEFVRAHNNLGLVYAHTKRLQAAIEEFTKGGSKPADAYSNAAVALAMDGHLNEAKRLYNLAIEIDSNCQAALKGMKELDTVLAREDQHDANVAMKRE